jgi:Na+/H+ antiporter NhaD/arsenite permease-like protein
VIHIDQRVAAALIAAATYCGVAIGKAPALRLDRAGAALLGAALLVATGVLTLAQAQRAIDFDTITLLLGMMIVVANLRLSGFFRVVTAWAVRRARHPLLLLGTIVLVSGLFSAFLVNDTICLVLTPLVLEVVQRLRRNPVPYLLAIAMASNTGSTATITGNPQNMIIGTVSGVSYGRFVAELAPVAALGLVLTVALLAALWPREFLTRERLFADPPPAHPHRFMIAKTLLVALALIVAFFWGVPPAKAAIVGGAILLLTRLVKPEKVYAQIDWPLLLMFAGLFIVVAGLERGVLTHGLLTYVESWHLDRAGPLAAVTAVLSNLVSNVPAVLVMKPFVAGLTDPQHAWLVVAMASTFAGNLTILGSVANLIVVQRARAGGVSIGFWDYFRAGAPLTVLSIAAGTLWLSL